MSENAAESTVAEGAGPIAGKIARYVHEENVKAGGKPGKQILTQEQLAEKKRVRKEKNAQFLSEIKDNKDGYPGFNRDWDAQALAIMREAGYDGDLNDIIAFPDSSGLSNPALALLEQDKVDRTSEAIMAIYGPDKVKGAENICYEGLLNRVQIGTIAFTSSLLGEGGGYFLRGVIYHECGHKVLKQPTECGLVFDREVSLMEGHFPGKGRDWAMKDGRSAAYHRANGLLKEPGRRQFVELLRKLLPFEEFFGEFKTQYEEIAGERLTVPADQIEQWKKEGKDELVRMAETKSIAVGDSIEGTAAQMAALIPGGVGRGKDFVKDVPGADKGGPSLVTFAEMLWAQEMKSANRPFRYKLTCVALTEVTKPTYLQNELVWVDSQGNKLVYGLFEDGPYPYTDKNEAVRAMNIAMRATDRVMTENPEQKREAVYRQAGVYIVEQDQAAADT